MPTGFELAGSLLGLVLVLVAIGLDEYTPFQDLLSKLHHQLVVFSKFLPQIPIFLSLCGAYIPNVLISLKLPD